MHTVIVFLSSPSFSVSRICVIPSAPRSSTEITCLWVRLLERTQEQANSIAIYGLFLLQLVFALQSGFTSATENQNQRKMLSLRGAAAVACRWRQTNKTSLISSFTHNHLQHKFPPYPPQTLASFPLYQSGFLCQTHAVSEATSEPIPIVKQDEEQSPENWKIKMLYDGDCPLCMREVNMLRERNKGYGTIKFVDISSNNYSPAENQGLDYSTVMGRIHAILSDGTVVKDVEAFRRLYEHVGLGWVYAITKYEPIASIADVVYGVWAKYRLQVTGRPPIEEIMETRKLKGDVCNDKDACKM